MLVLLALSFAVQDVEIIRRKDRIEYEEAVDLCRKAEARIATEPAKALEALDDLIEKRPLRKMECLVRIEVFADTPGAPVPLLPYQLRGRARQALAATAAADRRRLLEQALQDFETSTARGVPSSADLARGARRELLGVLKPALDPSINLLLVSMEANQQVAAVEAFAEELRAEAAAARRRLDDAGKKAGAEAGKTAAWCDRAAAALKGTKSGAAVSAELDALRVLAASLAAYRGSIQLKISASPYAEIVALKRDGKDIALTERFTPLTLPAPLEIGDLDLELRHPDWGRRSASYAANSFKDGARYVLAIDMSTGVLTLTPLP